MKSKPSLYKHIWVSVLLLLLSVTAVTATIYIARHYSSIYWLFMDELAANAAISFRQASLTPIMRSISWFGYWGVVASWGILSLVLALKKRFSLLLIAVTIAAAGTLSGLGVKSLVSRERPSLTPLVTETNYSYPSMHSLAITTFSFTLVFVLFVMTRSYLLAFGFEVLAFMLIVSVSASRLYLGVHYLSDVLAGYFLGIGIVSLVLGISKLVWLFTYRNKISLR